MKSKTLLLSILMTMTVSHADAKGLFAWCPKYFSALGKTEVSHPLNALRADFPMIQDPVKFAAVVRERRRQWNKLHPDDHNNFSMPEHKSGVDWLKNTLAAYKKDPYFNVRQRGSDMDAKHEAVVGEFLLRLESIEKRNYPHHDTLELSHRITRFIGELDSVVPPERIFQQVGFRNSRDWKPAAHAMLDDLFELAQNSIGMKRAQVQRKYDEALSDRVQNWLETEKILNVDAAVEYRNAEAELFAIRARQTPLLDINSGGRSIERSAVILSPGVDSIRGIAEAALFEIHPIGLVLKAEKVDNAVLTSNDFSRHDIIHFRNMTSDRYAMKIMRLSDEKKMRILNSIDSLQNSKQKEFAEFALLASLRENFGSEVRIGNSLKNRIAGMQRIYANVTGDRLAESDAIWMIDWLKKNVPVGPSILF